VDKPREPDWVHAVLAEYEAHRAEVLAEAAAQQQTLALGATGVGIVIAGAFNVWDDRLLAAIAFLGVVPLLSLVILVQWSGRASGLMRVGVYLEALEDAVRSAYPSLPSSAFSWERTRARGRSDKWWQPQYEWTDYGAIGTFVLLSFGSIGLGAYRAYAGNAGAVIPIVVCEGVAIATLSAALLYDMATIRGRVRRHLENA
jgi:hypothetical protein